MGDILNELKAGFFKSYPEQKEFKAGDRIEGYFAGMVVRMIRVEDKDSRIYTARIITRTWRCVEIHALALPPAFSKTVGIGTWIMVNYNPNKTMNVEIHRDLSLSAESLMIRIGNYLNDIKQQQEEDGSSQAPEPEQKGNNEWVVAFATKQI